MSRVIAGFSMSLDGFVADPDDSVEHVFKWYSAGGTEAKVMAGDQAFEMSREGAESIDEAGRAAGVLVRRSPSSRRGSVRPSRLLGRSRARTSCSVLPVSLRSVSKLGVLDAIHIDLVPVVLGGGIRLFDHLTKPIEFLVTEASGNPHVTHITYQVIKER
jgi:hypothetical protein